MHATRAERRALLNLTKTSEGSPLVGTPTPEPNWAAESQRGSRRSSSRRLPKRAAAGRRSFVSTLKSLDGLASAGAKVSVTITDLDRGTAVLTGDDYVTLPIAGLGIVPLLIEIAAGFESGRLDPLEIIERSSVDPVGVAGVWQHLKAPALPLADLAVLTASTGDALAANALLAPGYRPPGAATPADKLRGSRQRDDSLASSR
jgi:beta-lactamase class A